jgi:hypothetical protein
MEQLHRWMAINVLELHKQRNNVWELDLLWLLKCLTIGLFALGLNNLVVVQWFLWGSSFAILWLLVRKVRKIIFFQCNNRFFATFVNLVIIKHSKGDNNHHQQNAKKGDNHYQLSGTRGQWWIQIKVNKEECNNALLKQKQNTMQ